MSLKSSTAGALSKIVKAQTKKWASNAVGVQQKVFQNLIKSAADTAFGKEHNFKEIKTYEDFRKRVPVRDYEDLRPYIERILKGEKMFCGKAYRSILPKLPERLQVPNTFLSPKSLCRTISRRHEMPYCITSPKRETPVLWTVK